MSSTRRAPVIPSDHVEPVVRIALRAGRFWRAGLLAFVALAAVISVATALAPKHYQSEAVVFYKEGMQWNPNAGGVSPRRIGQKLKDMLLARTTLAKVIEELGLYPELVREGRSADAVEEMRLAVNFRFTDGDVFVLSFRGRSPDEAQRVTAKLTELLIAENTQLRSQQAEVAKDFLDAERKRKGEELSAKEAEQMRFLAVHPEFAKEPATAVGVMLRTRPTRAADIAAPSRDDGALGALRREEQRLRRQLASPDQVIRIPADPALLAARSEAEARLAAARRDLAERRGRFTDQHPDVLMAVSAVAAAESAYRAAADAVEAAERAPPVDARVVEKRLAQVRKDVATHERNHPGSTDSRGEAVESSEAARRIVAVETEWTRLTREVAEARDRLEALDSQQFMAAMTASLLTSGQAGQIVVIDPASRPVRPIGMSAKKRLLAGFALALLVGIGVALAAALLDDLIYDHVDVERLGLVPVLSEIPRRRGPGRAGGKLWWRGWRRSEAAPPQGRGEPPPSPAAQAAPPSSIAPVRELAGAAAAAPAAGPAPNGAADLRPASEALRALPAPSTVVAQAASGEEAARDADLPAGQPTTALSTRSAEPAQVTRAPAASLFSFDRARGGALRVQRIAPAQGIRGEIVMLAAPQSVEAASFRVLRHRLGEHKGVKTILVTSPNPGEGKTSTAANLALAMAEAGLGRVLLLEANFRHPSVARLLGLQPPVCLTRQFELHRADPTGPWLVTEAVAPWLDVAAVAPDTQDLPALDARMLAQCIDDLQAEYGYIVVDSPAVLGSADANLAAESCDAILIALSARTSRVRSFRKAVDQLGRAKVAGVVLLGT